MDFSDNKELQIEIFDINAHDEYFMVPQGNKSTLITFNPSFTELSTSILFRKKVNLSFGNINSILVLWQYNKTKADLIDLSTYPEILINKSINPKEHRIISRLSRSFSFPEEDEIPIDIEIITAASIKGMTFGMNDDFYLH